MNTDTFRVAGVEFCHRHVDVVTIPFDPHPDEAADAAWTRVPLRNAREDQWFSATRSAGPRVQHRVDWRRVVITFVERPMGIQDRLLLPTFGAIVAAIPFVPDEPVARGAAETWEEYAHRLERRIVEEQTERMRVADLTGTTWRSHLFGARTGGWTKDAARSASVGYAVRNGYPRKWPEDACQALCLAIAGRDRNRQDMGRNRELAEAAAR